MSKKDYKLGDHKIQKENISLPNPYSDEIEHFDNQIDELVDKIYRKDGDVKIVEPKKYKSNEETEFLFVDTEENLKVLKEHLEEEKVTEIAIDLEAH